MEQQIYDWIVQQDKYDNCCRLNIFSAIAGIKAGWAQMHNDFLRAQTSETGRILRLHVPQHQCSCFYLNNEAV